MINKNEVIYNSKSLTSAWLADVGDIIDLQLTFYKDNEIVIINCNKDDCGIKLAKVLLNNKNQYNKCILSGKVGNIKKEFGILDIK